MKSVYLYWFVEQKYILQWYALALVTHLCVYGVHICVPTCLLIRGHMCVCRYICLHAHVKTEVVASVFPTCSLFYFWRQVSSSAQLTSQLAPGISFLFLPSPRFACQHHTFPILLWFHKCEHQSSGLYSKCFIHKDMKAVYPPWSSLFPPSFLSILLCLFLFFPSFLSFVFLSLLFGRKLLCIPHMEWEGFHFK